MRTRTILIAGAALLAAVGGGLAYAAFVPPATPPLAHAEARTAYDFKLVGIDGEPMPMRQYAGKVVLLVNTASMCGYKAQLGGLQTLQTAYAAKGFTVIGVPSGNFLDQEYKSGKEIKSFCQGTFGVKYPLAERSDVVGPRAIPIYRWAAGVLGPENTPRWNFHKYLIGRDGRLITAFGTKTDPNDPKLTAAIEAALKAPPNAPPNALPKA